MQQGSKALPWPPPVGLGRGRAYEYQYGMFPAGVRRDSPHESPETQSHSRHQPALERLRCVGLRVHQSLSPWGSRDSLQRACCHASRALLDQTPVTFGAVQRGTPRLMHGWVCTRLFCRPRHSSPTSSTPCRHPIGHMDRMTSAGRRPHRHPGRRSPPQLVDLLPLAHEGARHGEHREAANSEHERAIVEGLAELVEGLGRRVERHKEVHAKVGDHGGGLEHRGRAADAPGAGDGLSVGDHRLARGHADGGRVLREPLLLVRGRGGLQRPPRVDDALVQREELAVALREEHMARGDALGRLRDGDGVHAGGEVVGLAECVRPAPLKRALGLVQVPAVAGEEHARKLRCGRVLIELHDRHDVLDRRRRPCVHHGHVLGDGQLHGPRGPGLGEVVHGRARHAVEQRHVHGAVAAHRKALGGHRLRVGHADEVGVEVLVQHAAVPEDAHGGVHRLGRVRPGQGDPFGARGQHVGPAELRAEPRVVRRGPGHLADAVALDRAGLGVGEVKVGARSRRGEAPGRVGCAGNDGHAHVVEHECARLRVPGQRPDHTGAHGGRGRHGRARERVQGVHRVRGPTPGDHLRHGAARIAPGDHV
mmetsp:Transcript_15792/g.53165  ORF Transcript_15792/g.53165 Transcript_15792/m.53165 type:complete len:593 (-) Transcript_15792:762-2540(-)